MFMDLPIVKIWSEGARGEIEKLSHVRSGIFRHHIFWTNPANYSHTSAQTNSMFNQRTTITERRMTPFDGWMTNMIKVHKNSSRPNGRKSWIVCYFHEALWKFWLFPSAPAQRKKWNKKEEEINFMLAVPFLCLRVLHSLLYMWYFSLPFRYFSVDVLLSICRILSKDKVEFLMNTYQLKRHIDIWATTRNWNVNWTCFSWLRDIFGFDLVFLPSLVDMKSFEHLI